MTWWLRDLLTAIAVIAAYRELLHAWFLFRRRRLLGRHARGLRLVVTTRRSNTVQFTDAKAKLRGAGVTNDSACHRSPCHHVSSHPEAS